MMVATHSSWRIASRALIAGMLFLSLGMAGVASAAGHENDHKTGRQAISSDEGHASTEYQHDRGGGPPTTMRVKASLSEEAPHSGTDRRAEPSSRSSDQVVSTTLTAVITTTAVFSSDHDANEPQCNHGEEVRKEVHVVPSGSEAHGDAVSVVARSEATCTTVTASTTQPSSTVTTTSHSLSTSTSTSTSLTTSSSATTSTSSTGQASTTSTAQSTTTSTTSSSTTSATSTSATTTSAATSEESRSPSSNLPSPSALVSGVAHFLGALLRHVGSLFKHL